MPLPNIYALTDTRWSNAGTTLNGIWLDINNGAVGAGIGTADSKVIRLTNNFSNFFAVSLSGWCGACIPAGDGGFAFTNFEGYVDYTRLFSSQRFTAAGGVAGRSNVVICNGGNLGYTTPADGAFAFNSVATGIGVDAGNPGNNDVWLRRDAANTLALRNGTNAQAFNVYNTFTDSSNWERIKIGIGVNANRFIVGVDALGTGSQRSLDFWGVDLNFAVGAGGGQKVFDCTSARFAVYQNFAFANDGVNDIGTISGTLSRSKNMWITGAINYGVLTVASITASISSQEGSLVGCSNLSTIAVGTTVTGSGTGHALLYFDATQWKVVI